MYPDNTYPENMVCPNCGVPYAQTSAPVNATKTVCQICKSEVKDTENSYSCRFVTVYVPRNESEHLAAQALLESAHIDFFSKNFTVQNLFGAGQIGTGFNIVTGPIQIQVPEEDADEARELLEDYFSAQIYTDDHLENDWQERRYLIAQSQVDKMTTRAIIFCVFWFGGLGASIGIYYALKSLRIIGEFDEPLQGKLRSYIALALASLEVIISPYLWMKIITEFQMM